MITVTYKNVGNPNNLSKCVSEPVDVPKNVSNFPHSHYISACLLLQSDRIKFFTNKEKGSVSFYVSNANCVLKMENNAVVDISISMSNINLFIYGYKIKTVVNILRSCDRAS